MHIGDHVRRNAAVRPDDPAYTCGDRTHSWSETNSRVNQLASYLVETRTRGDRVAVFATNCHRYFEIYFACAKAGMVCVPVNSRLLDTELLPILADSGSRLLFVDGRLEVSADVIGSVAELDVVGFGDHPFAVDYEDLLRDRPVREVDVDVRPDETSVIAFTSGTTGRPKGAMLTHTACVLSAYSYALNMLVTPADRCLAVMPAYVYRGGSGGFAPAVVGAESVVAKFGPATVLDLIEQRRVTHATLAPAMIGQLLARPDIADRDLSCLRALWTGGAPIRPETLARLHGLVGQIVGAQYGMTEATGIAIINYRPGDVERLASVGRPTSLVDVRLVAPGGDREVEIGEVGEIWVRGAAVTTGYWNAPELDSQVFDDGWFKTGDMARRDENGELYIVDRRIDIINSGGINVYSLEVENVIARHPDVLECAVIGVPDDIYGEAVMAVVAVRPGAALDRDDIDHWCREQLAGFKKPRHITIVGSLERNALGKINKKGLRQEFWSGQERMVSG